MEEGQSFSASTSLWRWSWTGVDERDGQLVVQGGLLGIAIAIGSVQVVPVLLLGRLAPERSAFTSPPKHHHLWYSPSSATVAHETDDEEQQDDGQDDQDDDDDQGQVPLGGLLDDGTGQTGTRVASGQAARIILFQPQVILTLVNDQGPANDGSRTKESGVLDHKVQLDPTILGHFNVAKVSAVSRAGVATPMAHLGGVEVTSGSSAVVAIVGKLMDMETMRARWKPGNDPDHPQVGVLIGLFEPDVRVDAILQDLDLGH